MSILEKEDWRQYKERRKLTFQLEGLSKLISDRLNE